MNEPWSNVRRIDSSDTNVSKYVFEKDNAVAEAVLYRYGSYNTRTVVCCSTQSGCPIGCRFCGAGDAFVRSLTDAEIVAQTAHLFADRDIDPERVERMQIMFMSMGEPLLNLTNLALAIEELHRRYPRAALLISTSAPRVDYDKVVDLSMRVPKVGLQFSVHESTDEARDRLIPFREKLTLAEIADVGEVWHAVTGRQPFFNYCVHPGNNTQTDVDRLLGLFNPAIWQATLSVICERDEHIAAANARQRALTEDFQQRMLRAGYSTRMFDPAGQDDIGGGCGQLWFVQEWMRNHPQMARPSVGRKLPVVHTPH